MLVGGRVFHRGRGERKWGRRGCYVSFSCGSRRLTAVLYAVVVCIRKGVDCVCARLCSRVAEGGLPIGIGYCRTTGAVCSRDREDYCDVRRGIAERVLHCGCNTVLLAGRVCRRCRSGRKGGRSGCYVGLACGSCWLT